MPVEPLTVFVVWGRAYRNGAGAGDVVNAAGRKPADNTEASHVNEIDNALGNEAKAVYLLHRRPGKGLLAGMWEFPNCQGEGKEGKEKLAACLAKLGLNLSKVSGAKQKIRHVFTHKVWQMTVYHAMSEMVDLPDGWRWVTTDEISNYNLAGPHNKIQK